MSPQARKDLSKAEWKITKIVWEMKKAVAREVYIVAGAEHEWTPATVKTLLKRLVDKAWLTATPVGNGFVYRPAESAIVALRSAADKLLDHAIEGTSGPLLAHMFRQTDLTDGEIDQLQKLIDQKRESSQQKVSLQKSNRKNSPRRKN